jgi:predicted butyrate kinase (DUF1464 family)
MPRVAGTDPGTSSLDVVILDGGAVIDQQRFPAAELATDPASPVRWLAERGPFDLVAGPSGYGLPLVRAHDCTDRDLALMALVRPDGGGQSHGVRGFTSVVRALRASSLPVIFLPSVIHLPTVPAHRKFNRVDLGTADKLCVAALAIAQGRDPALAAELGSAFTACLVISDGRIVDGVGGTAGPIGWQSGGAWDGEVAYLFGSIAKKDLFAGGAAAVGGEDSHCCFRESLLRTVAGLRAVTPFAAAWLSGRLVDNEPELAQAVRHDLLGSGLTRVERLPSLPGAWVKHAAQGAAIIADGLAGGKYAHLVERMRLREASGTVLDWIRHPRAAEVRAAFGLGP